MTHIIDCHVLTMPSHNQVWADQLRADLDREAVNQHWLPGIDGQLGAALAQGYAQGDAPFVSYADPDDRILYGTYAALLHALQANPGAPFAWTGELLVDENLVALGAPTLAARGYSQRSHRNSAMHVHGVILYRRACVAPLLPRLATCGWLSHYLLSLLVARPDLAQPAGRLPVHVPLVGRLWRQHGANASKGTTARDMQMVRDLSGVSAAYI
ncbi:MAG: hypothetical protein EOO27_27010 [Comamonadaceae bacterium]|nr:MAG: hypothetical protein EOO27_27010 [Comamonadaceae bacterium]